MLKLIFGMLFIFTGGMSMLADQAKSGLTLEDIFQSDQFQGKTVTDVQWLPDGSAFTFTRFNAGSGERDIYRHNVATGEESLILDGGSLSLNGQPVRMTAYQTTGQQNTLLLTGPRKQLWRHSYVAPYYLYDITQKSLLPLAKGDPALQNVSLSPDGKRV
ncbi:MAG TPA: DPP IV N-terminal domain-containing protein, partial [Calditrichia bacterium]|nr:DPP IV N-terminal domain-containing protein [Calditrichia bacterium]